MIHRESSANIKRTWIFLRGNIESYFSFGYDFVVNIIRISSSIWNEISNTINDLCRLHNIKQHDKKCLHLNGRLWALVGARHHNSMLVMTLFYETFQPVQPYWNGIKVYGHKTLETDHIRFNPKANRLQKCFIFVWQKLLIHSVSRFWCESNCIISCLCSCISQFLGGETWNSCPEWWNSRPCE